MSAVDAMSVACCEAGMYKAQPAVSNACQTADFAVCKQCCQGIAAKLAVSLLPVTKFTFAGAELHAKAS